MNDKYKWILDSREKKSSDLGKINIVAIAKKEEEQKPGTWIIGKPLRLSTFIHLPSNQPDLDCGDMTNENADGIVEFKSYSDLIGSTTGSGEEGIHLSNQLIKMHSTGIPRAVIVYGSREVFQLVSNVSDDVILSGLRKATVSCAIFKATMTFVKDENEAIETAKSFIRHCNELPYNLPALHLLKRGGSRAVGMYVGIDLIGEKTAKLLHPAWKCPAFLSKFILEEFIKTLSIARVAAMVKEKTPGLRIDQATTIVMTFIEGSDIVKLEDQIEHPVELPEGIDV